MRYAICILAHDNPGLLARIVGKLRRENTEILVHIDQKSDISRFADIDGAVFIRDRETIYWGGRAIVVAMLNLIKFAVNNTDCDYLLFISGQDYPLVDPLNYPKFIDPERNYLEYESLPKAGWPEGGFDRLKHYYLFNNKDLLVSRVILKLQRSLPFERKRSLNQTVFAGSQWINFNRKTANYIIDNWDRYFSYFKYTRVPDEMIFQTIVLNSEFGKVTENRNLRYLRFPPNTPHPLYLTPADVTPDAVRNAIFCRKIENSEVFDQFERAQLSS